MIYAGITGRGVAIRIAEHWADGKRHNIRNVRRVCVVANGRVANAWERSMRLRGYDTEPGGVSDTYPYPVDCYTFTFDLIPM